MRVATLLPFHPLNIPGVVKSGAITPGAGSWAKWAVHVRGPSVFLISAPGWRPGNQPEGTQRQVFEIPRSHCHLQWEFSETDKLEDVVKHDPVVAPVVITKGDSPLLDTGHVGGSVKATIERQSQPQATTPAAGTTPDVEDSPSTPAAATAPINQGKKR